MGGQYPLIEELVRHRAPMLLLDRVENEGHRTTTCGLTIREDSTFLEDGAVPSFVALEYMAQCVAVHAGLCGVRNGQQPRIGYLVGARDVDFLVDEFRVGEHLRVIASHVWGDDELGQYRVHLESNGRRVAQAILSVYQANGKEAESREARES